MTAKAEMTVPVSTPETQAHVSEKLAKFLDRLDTEMAPQQADKPAR